MELGDFKNLIFLAIAIGAWLLKAGFERREQNARRGEANAARGRRESQGASRQVAEPSVEEPDVVYGRRPLPPRYTTLSEALPDPAPALPRRPAKTPPPPPIVTGLRPPVGEHSFDGIADRRMEGDLKTTAAATVRQNQAGANTRRRLGIDRMGGTQRALRAAILWGEVLGPPRALRGAYRTPAAQRRAALL